MDILTQGLLGAALAQSVADKTTRKSATWTGFLAGLLADADVLISSNRDPLLTLEYHRHFTHSVFFIPVGALLAACLLWYFSRHKLTFKQLYLFCFAGYSLSGFIDACTSYGTYLFWPLIDQRISFNIISIVDPVFTLILLAGVFLAWEQLTARYAYFALVLCGAYLLLGLIQHNRAYELAQSLIAERAHPAKKVLVKPSFANILLWRTVYVSDHKIHVDALRLGINTKVYPGESVSRFNVQKDLPELSTDSILYSDLKRFNEFSHGYVARDPGNENILGDIRYSMLPTSIKPLWGIRIDPQQEEQHVSYGFYRDISQADRSVFIAMLLGRESEKEPGQ